MSHYDLATTLAKRLVDAGQAATIEQARVAVFRARPALYEAVREEAEAQARRPVSRPEPPAPPPITGAYAYALERASALVKVGKAKTLEQAVAAVFKAEPDLYARHVAQAAGGPEAA